MADPIAASVVIPYRQSASGLEVYWVLRSHKLAFLPGFWAFPGGRVDPEDARTPVEGAEGERAARIAAAARELREETGLALPVREPTFAELARTVTPDWAPIRFDATYYLVEVPAGTTLDPAGCSGGELIDGEWVTPAAALVAYTSGARLTSPVVAHFLRGLLGGLAGAGERSVAAAAQELHAPQLWELAPGVANAALRSPTLPPATTTNCYVIGGREMVVIDPASPWKEERAVLDRALDELATRGRRVREIWLTHHHVDHVSGAAHLAERLGVPVAAHPTTAALVAGRIEVARSLADGHVEVLPGDGKDIPERRLRCVFTPGHAPGHHCFLEETTGFLVAGDMVAGDGSIIVDPDEGDMRDYLDSLRRMAELAPRALLPAHGLTITDPQAKIAEYIHHRLWREERVANALAARGRATALALVPAVYEDVPTHLHPLAARSLLAHLQKLVKDGRVRADGDAFERLA
jgi:glyoxylase-like metal-dependent hydrolase (beta-lactamase superfamily II)/8-oxo-dGTP pyrophosphatase MutT (NUDIX family)